MKQKNIKSASLLLVSALLCGVRAGASEGSSVQPYDFREQPKDFDYGSARRAEPKPPPEGKQPFCVTTHAPGAIERLVTLPQGLYAAWWPEFISLQRQGQRRLMASIMCSKSISQVTGGGNCLVDLSSGQILQAPGLFDGVWVKDARGEPIYTVPNKFNAAHRNIQPGLNFFRFNDVLQRGQGTPVLFRDPSFGNHYHSFGMVSQAAESGGSAVHRVLNDKWGASYRDYRFDYSPSGDVLRIEAAGPEYNLTNSSEDSERPRTAPVGRADDREHFSYFDLPMISPDGKLFAVNNRRTMTTQIFEILPGGGKRLVSDLGIETGKVSFAPRKPHSKDLHIAFHVDQLDPAEGDKMSGVSPWMTKDIVVMRLVERPSAQGFVFDPAQLVRVTNSDRVGDGNYYPKWINDEELIFVESANYNRQTFVKVNISKLRFQGNVMPAAGRSISRSQYIAAAALGLYLTGHCTNYSHQLKAKELAMHAVRLDRGTCQSLAKQWDSWRAYIQTSGEFLTLRPPKPPGVQRTGGYNFSESLSQRGSERFELPPRSDEIAALTRTDIEAVCKQIN